MPILTLHTSFCSFHSFLLHSTASLAITRSAKQRALTVASTGTPESESFATATRDAERIRKQMQTQHAEFEIRKKSLVKLLQNRCEKVRGVQ